MTIVGLHDFVKVSISAEFKSFWLIICIDAPESTTNSRSSDLRLDARRHLFSEGEKNVALLFSPLIFRIFLASLHAASRAHRSCHIPSLLETDPQILEHRGNADEDHLGKSFQAMDFGLEYERAIAFVNFTYRIGFLLFDLFRKIDEDFGGSIS